MRKALPAGRVRRRFDVTGRVAVAFTAAMLLLRASGGSFVSVGPAQRTGKVVMYSSRAVGPPLPGEPLTGPVEDSALAFQPWVLSLASLAATLGVIFGLCSSPALADEIDDEVGSFIAAQKKDMLLNQDEQAVEEKKTLPLPDFKSVPSFTWSALGAGGGGGQALLDNEAEYKEKKYQKMKDKVLNAKTENERMKHLRVMKSEALRDAIPMNEGWLIK
mmetsp:Transcript_45644/g.82407  ORF Transcript_45644/g.82407 Transcript_45644/m.82407 type:complete len:218 (-) Transcript_45644:101-754(-)|eukprot:CAMPEP_0115057974 /NCGR_PEP_ID=MMETSP0227-20121206/6072_1 /TAXON_ID=89957 /ORGANISM="Polarella glacialis, Strain CCMP 1383" /LENGTH=217 /DNA_ID=CAMNT_0002442869 /DNA_START=53 /DNA_END=706 /DNA_ORIENTATION=-